MWICLYKKGVASLSTPTTTEYKHLFIKGVGASLLTPTTPEDGYLFVKRGVALLITFIISCWE